GPAKSGPESTDGAPKEFSHGPRQPMVDLLQPAHRPDRLRRLSLRQEADRLPLPRHRRRAVRLPLLRDLRRADVGHHRGVPLVALPRIQGRLNNRPRCSSAGAAVLPPAWPETPGAARASPAAPGTRTPAPPPTARTDQGSAVAAASPSRPPDRARPARI